MIEPKTKALLSGVEPDFLKSIMGMTIAALVKLNGNKNMAFEELKSAANDGAVSEEQLKAIIELCAELPEVQENIVQLWPARNSHELQSEIFTQLCETIKVGAEINPVIAYYAEEEKYLSTEDMNLFALFVLANIKFISEVEMFLTKQIRNGISANKENLENEFPSQPLEKLVFLSEMFSV